MSKDSVSSNLSDKTRNDTSLKKPNPFLDSSFDPPGVVPEYRKLQFESQKVDQKAIVNDILAGRGTQSRIERLSDLMNQVDLKGPALLKSLEDGLNEVSDESNLKMSSSLRNLRLAINYIDDKKITNRVGVSKLREAANNAVDSLLDNSCNIASVIILKSLSMGISREQSLQCGYTALSMHCFKRLRAVSEGLNNPLLSEVKAKLNDSIEVIENLLTKAIENPAISNKVKIKQDSPNPYLNF